MALALDYQAQVRDLVIGAGTDYQFAKKGPLAGFGVPPLRSPRRARAQAAGTYAEPQYEDERAFRWKTELFGSSSAHALELAIDLAGAMAPLDPDGDARTLPFIFRLAGSTFRVFGVPTRCEIDYSLIPQGTLRADCEFVATDPLIYSDAEHPALITPAIASGGLSFPHGFPHGFGTIAGGAGFVVNLGNRPVFPHVVFTAGIDGASGIRIENLATGAYVLLNSTLGAGESLELDFAARTVLLGGSVSRAADIVRPESSWWRIDPGTTPVAVTVTVGTGTLTVTNRDGFSF